MEKNDIAFFLAVILMCLAIPFSSVALPLQFAAALLMTISFIGAMEKRVKRK